MYWFCFPGPICLNTFDLFLGKLKSGGKKYRMCLIGVLFKVKSENDQE